MRTKVPAIGYLRSDISGIRQQWDDTCLRSLARRLGYDIVKTVVFSAATAAPTALLVVQVRLDQAEAVFTPSLDHLGGGETAPPELLAVTDLITVTPQLTFSRWNCSPFGE